MSSRLNWLHISDIHFCLQKEWRDSGTRTELLDYLRNIFDSDASLKPDFVFCTGDISFGELGVPGQGLAYQYSWAEQFFDALLAICGPNNQPLPRDRLFVVPGNHDINRTSINSDAQTTLTSWAKESTKHVETINQRVDDCSREFRDAIKRLDEYNSFVSKYLPHQHDQTGRAIYTSVVELNGIKVGIAGFNSAWSCAGPEDDRNIWLAAKWQFNAAHRVLKGVDINIGLIHHPIDWLNLSDRDVANQRIAGNFDFWLHGHNHNTWVTPNQSHVVIAAGAVGAETSSEFGVNIVSLDMNELKGVVHLHNTKADGTGWTILPISHHAPAGKWIFDFTDSLKSNDTIKSIAKCVGTSANSGNRFSPSNKAFVDRQLQNRLDDSLRSFTSQPIVWIDPILSSQPEIAVDAKSKPKVPLRSIIEDPSFTIIKAPPQYGLTCLAHYLILQAWRKSTHAFWLYLDSKQLKPHTASIEKATNEEMERLGCEVKMSNA